MHFRKIWIWVFFIGFALFLLSSNSGPRQTWNPADQLIVEIIAPFQKLTKQTANAVKEFWLDYFYLVNVRRENTRLRREIDVLRMENSRYTELLVAYESLQKLLQFKHAIDRPVVAVQVIGGDPTGWFKSVIIDKGKSSGLSVNMPVVNACGAVGRIVSVSPNYAKVLLIIDQNSGVDCLVQRSRDRGIVKGLSTEICKLDYVAKSSDVITGDMVVTSGLGGIFPKGLPVGEVLSVSGTGGELFKDIEIRPTVNFSKLEEVLVILRENKSLDHHKEKK